jgi:excinuclease ABC subunit C
MCLAPCKSLCSLEKYQEQVKFAKDFLLGKNKIILKILKTKMKKASDDLNFEKANYYLKITKKIKEIQRVENLKTKDVDAIGIYQDQKNVIITKLIFRDYRLIGSSFFSFLNIFSEKETILENFLLQHYKKNLLN